MDAVARCIVTAQVVGSAGDNALARPGPTGGRGVVVTSASGALCTRGPRNKQQLHIASHTGTKHRAQQPNVAKSHGMRGEVGRKVDHALKLVGLVQVLEELFPRSMGRRLIAARVLRGYDLHMVAGERLGAKVIVNICGVANNQHFHGVPPPQKSTFAIVKHAYCTL